MRSPRIFLILCALCVLGVLCVERPTIAQAPSWLDQPLNPWNQAGAPLPRGAAPAATLQSAQERCKLTVPSSDAAKALAAAGWLAQEHFDQALERGDTEILLGLSSLDGMCRPMDFNLFVFVAGRFAGTLAPSLMSSRSDGAIGPVRFVEDLITAEFARYKNEDALCCPSARMTVRYRIERSPNGAAVVPTDVRTTRSY